MFIGMLFLIFGILFLLEMIFPGFSVNYNVIWPAIIIIFSLYQMIKKRHVDLFMIVLLLIGMWGILRFFHLVPQSMQQLIGPIILIVIGLFLVFETRCISKKIRIKNVNGLQNFYGIFGGVEEKINSNDFKGATVYSIFGGVELDLSSIKIKETAIRITVYSIFGGTDLKMPKDANIKVHSIALFGSVNNECDNEEIKDRTTIHLNCYSIFGGTDLK